MAVSVIVSVYSTFVSEPKKTQNFPFTVRPSSTLKTRSMLSGSKNQKPLVCDEMFVRFPDPVSPFAYVQVTVAANRAGEAGVTSAGGTGANRSDIVWTSASQAWFRHGSPKPASSVFSSEKCV